MDLPYRRYFEEIPCYVTVQDRGFRVVDSNRRFREDFGDPEGRFCYQVYKHRHERCEICPVDQTFQDGQGHQNEEQVCTLDGREMSVMVYTSPIRDETGAITSVLEISADISDVKRLQRQLKESQRRYRLLFEEVPCFISIQGKQMNTLVFSAPIHDSDGEIQYVMEMSTNITPIRELQSQLESIGLLIRSVSH